MPSSSSNRRSDASSELLAQDAASAVSAEQQIGCLRLGIILCGLMIALPAFVMGAQLHMAMGMWRAVGASAIGGLIVAVVAAATGAIGAFRRKSTYELVTEAFGVQGARLVNAVLGLTLLGWFGVIASLFGETLVPMVHGTLASVGVPGWTSLGGVLVIATTLYGFRALDRLSLLITPLKLLLLVWAFVMALRTGAAHVLAFQPTSPMPFGTGVSLVAGGVFVGATLSPDLCRFARSPGHAALACAFAYGLGFPLVLTLAGVAAVASGHVDLVALMLTLGLGLPAVLTVLLAAWGTNAYNLYACGLVTGTIWPSVRWWPRVVVAGIIGTLFGVSGWSTHVTPFLLVLSMAIPPVAAIYLVHACLSMRWPHLRVSTLCPFDALFAWVVGASWAGVMHAVGWQWTAIPALDSFLIALATYASARFFALKFLPMRSASWSGTTE